jgi:hypothetical protein
LDIQLIKDAAQERLPDMLRIMLKEQRKHPYETPPVGHRSSTLNE